MESIPHDLLIKISNLLSTRERARLAVVSKEWQQVVSDSWTDVRLEPAADCDEEHAFERGKHLAWLGRLAKRSPHTLQSVYIHHLPAFHCLLPEFGLHCCTRLQRLELKGKHSGGNRHPATITPEAMQRLSSLIHLEVLSLSLERRASSRRSEELSLQGIAILPKLQHLDLGLDGGLYWTLAHLREPGFQSLNSLRIEKLRTWNSQWMPEVISRLEALRLAVYTTITQVTNTSDAPKLTSLEYRCLQHEHPSLMPFKTSANLRMLSSLNVIVPQNMPSVNCNMASLELRIAHQPSDIIRSWSTLTSLTELSVGCSSLGQECIMQPFTCLSMLKSLSILGCRPEYLGGRVLEPHDGIMGKLTNLTISFGTRSATYNVGMLSNREGTSLKWAGEFTSKLPALKEMSLTATHGDLTGEICSSTLEVLSMTCSRILCQSPQASLGELPCLHTLTLLLSKSFHEAKAMLGQSLPALKNLRELSLLVTRGWGEAPPGHDDTIDVVLGALSAFTGLTALKIFIPTSDINLSLVNFPSLIVLSVGSKAVHFGLGIGSSLQRRDLVLDLLFSEASDQVLDQLRACQDSVVRLPAGDGLMFFNVRRRANQVVRVEPPFKSNDLHCFVRGMVRYLRVIAGLSPHYRGDDLYTY